MNGSPGTSMYTILAEDTVQARVAEYWQSMLGFGVTAPKATQGASLEKDHGADAGTIVDAIALDVEDHAGFPLTRPHFLVPLHQRFRSLLQTDVFGSGNDVILDFPGQFHETGAVASNPND